MAAVSRRMCPLLRMDKYITSFAVPMTIKNKVAPITPYFWALKILATTLGETGGDMLAHTLGMGYMLGFFITAMILVALLTVQVTSKAFHPLLFWLAILGTTTAGTEISDMMDRTFGLGYLYGSLLLTFALLATLFFWHVKAKSLSVYPITSRNIELLFWIAVLLSNSLGTAFGDYLTDTLGLSYVHAALFTFVWIALVLLVHYATTLNQVFLFWIAFIFTRPFGATFGDLLTKPHAQGGLNIGTISASVITVGIFMTVLWFSHRRASEKDRITGT